MPQPLQTPVVQPKGVEPPAVLLAAPPLKKVSIDGAVDREELLQFQQQAIARPAVVAKPHISKVALASLVGTSIEWYDYFLYGTAAALVFNKLFFPKFDPVVGTILAFLTFTIGFVARPFAGVVFGHFGDRIGRKQMLY